MSCKRFKFERLADLKKKAVEFANLTTLIMNLPPGWWATVSLLVAKYSVVDTNL
jgi:hypothetical protein